MAEEHYGPEIVERFEAGASVRDVKAATTYLIGTAPVHLLADASARAAAIESDVIVRSAADAVKVFGPFGAAAGYSIPQALHAIFNKDRGTGVGTIVVRNVFDPDRHRTGGAPDPAAVAAADIVGALGAGGIPTGLEAVPYLYSKFGFLPKRIIAPGFSTQLAVRQKMLATANRVRAVAIADLPVGLTRDQALALRGVAQPYQSGADRMVYCWPHVRALDPVTGDQTLQPYSQHFAGVWNEICQREEGDDDGGPAASPSNRPMVDVSGLELPITFYPGDYSADTNLINAAGLVTANAGLYGGPVLTWGRHASSHPTSSDLTRWLHVRTMYDVLHEAILFFLMRYVDRRGTPQRVELVEEQIQRYVNRKERDGWLYGGRFRFDRAKNTADEILNEGRFWYRLDGSPVGIMSRLTVESYIDLTYARAALGLTAS